MLFFVVIYYLTLNIGLYAVFSKTDEDNWKALVPGLNFILWSQLVRRPLFIWMALREDKFPAWPDWQRIGLVSRHLN